MSEQQPPEANNPATTEEQTTVGNYFVANYPPFSFWSGEGADAAHEVLGAASPDAPLGIYFHIPFCRKRCHFCYFRVYTDRNAEEIKRYLDALIHEAELYARQPGVSGRPLRFIYFGGGTPSYLSAKQLKYLTDGLKGAMAWDQAEEVTFECEPGTLNEKKLQAVRDFGVTRLSLGVEHFDDEILKLNNRAHLSPEIFTAFESARRIGFPQINIDLIAGMMGETEASWKACVKKAIDLQADSVTIYQMEVPYNTTIFKEMQELGHSTAPIADWPTKRRWVAEAFEAFEKAGYRAGSAYTLIREDKAATRFVYRDALWNGADLLGLGVASFSHFQGVHFQNLHDSAPYESSLAEDKLPIYRAYRMTEDERFLREFLLQLKLGRVSARGFIEKFGIDPRERFAERFAAWDKQGFGGVRGEEIHLTRLGLLQVDFLLHQLFLPEHRNARYA